METVTQFYIREMGISGFWYPQNQFEEQFHRSLQLKKERERKLKEYLDCRLLSWGNWKKAN